MVGKKKIEDGAEKSRKVGKVSVLLASMDQKPDEAKKVTSSSSTARNTKPKAPAKVQAYADIDLPPSDDEEDEVESGEEIIDKGRVSRKERASDKNFEISKTDMEKKKRKKNKVEPGKQEVTKDDHDAFTVVIGCRAAVLDGQDDANANVKDITVDNFSVLASGKELLKDTSLKISHGNKYGLVGRNGTGKSTLLKLLAWRKIPVPKNIDVLLVEQEIVGDERTALEAVVSANVELVKLRQEVSLLEKKDGHDSGEKLAELYEKLQIMGADAAEAQASKILAGLGFTKVMQTRATKILSGGWRMRISLARALFIQPTLLLLDEPTNHLDLRAALWLEEYLCRWKYTLVVVSHDRDFLNTVCNGIIHLDSFELHLYGGNYDNFEKEYRKEKNKCDKQVKAAKRDGNQKQEEKVKEKAKAKFSVKEQKKKSKGKVDNVVFHFPKPTELTPPLLQLYDVSFSYPEKADFKLSKVDVGIDMGTRVAIVGLNGAGKSTLLKLLVGDLNPTEGEVRRNQKLRIGWYSQHFVDILTMGETPVQYLLRLHPDQEGCSKQEAVRSKLGKFGLPPKNHLTPIAKLSGGQKARVVFTSIFMSRPQILFLDEPTNHLDMKSIDALADALNEFTGGVVLVSHDSRLISRVCDDKEKSEIWEVDNGVVKKIGGSFEDYKQDLLKKITDEFDE